MRVWPALVIVLSFSALAQADPIPVFSTGNGQTADAAVDPHWRFTNSNGTSANALVANTPCVDFWVSCLDAEPAWMANTSSSAWLVDNTTSPQSGGNPLSFQTAFDLTGLNPSTADIVLEWGVDDGGDLLLNGNLVQSLFAECCTGLNWRSLHSVSLNSGFLSGLNTLQVRLTTNNNLYEGIRVQIDSATAAPLAAVPEPSTLAALAVALAILAAVRYFR